MLEDQGYYCIDNLPASLLPGLVERVTRKTVDLPRIAVSIDARNISSDLKKVPEIIQQLDLSILQPEIIFLDANSPTLIKRFSESRRKHPLTTDKIGLQEAINMERTLLEPIAADRGNFQGDNLHPVADVQDELRDHVWPALAPLLD